MGVRSILFRKKFNGKFGMIPAPSPFVAGILEIPQKLTNMVFEQRNLWLLSLWLVGHYQLSLCFEDLRSSVLVPCLAVCTLRWIAGFTRGGKERARGSL